MVALSALHVIAITLWLNELFVLSAVMVMRDHESEAPFKDRLQRLARRLALVADMSAAVAILTGVYLMVSRSLASQPWMLIKVVLVGVDPGGHPEGGRRERAVPGAGDPHPGPGGRGDPGARVPQAAQCVTSTHTRTGWSAATPWRSSGASPTGPSI